MSASVVRILEFLTHLHEIGKSYNTINVYRSMLSTTLPEVNGVKLGVHPLIKRLLAGCYNSNPPRPRYESTWDPQQVISFISGLGSNAQLSLAQLSYKTVTIIALATLLRVSELAAISLSSVAFVQGGARFSLSKPRKAQHTGPLQSLFIPSFADHECCPVDSLKEYVRRTTSLRKGGENSSLFISVIAPHAEVTSNTLSRWVKNQLGLAGVDTNFSAHSTRGAAASAAAAKGASIDDILKAGSWTREATFNSFYRRAVRQPVASAIFSTDRSDSGPLRGLQSHP